MARKKTLNTEEELQKTAAELEKVKEELDAQAWGLNKTNEAIKLLYKELEKKNKELQKLDELKSEFVSTSHKPISIVLVSLYPIST